MEEKSSKCEDLRHDVAAQLYPDALNTDRDHFRPAHLSQPRQQIQGFCPAPNIYGSVAVSGEAKVQLGDIYIYNIGTSKERSASAETAPYWPWSDSEPQRLSAATATSQATLSLLPWLLRVTYKQLLISSKCQPESRRSIQIDVLEKWRLYLGYATAQDFGLQIYRPRLHNIVPTSAPIIQACLSGDLISLRQVLLTKQGTVADITMDNFSPLFLAIDNGHSHLVRELLDAGADPNQLIGENQTSPLQWAARQRDETSMRLLISSGASFHHISRLGRSALSYLWISEKHLQPTCVQLMNLFRTADSAEFRRSHQTLVDIYGFSTINRVACMGTHDELELLLQDGADTKSLAGLEWDAMFNATHRGDYRNVEVLAPYFPGFEKRRDLRGWTLLHIAAGEGHTDIVRYLLKNGADWEAKSWPSYEYINDTLKGKTCTPAQVAAAVGDENGQSFLHVVEEVLGHPCQAAVDTDDDNDNDE